MDNNPTKVANEETMQTQSLSKLDVEGLALLLRKTEMDSSHIFGPIVYAHVCVVVVVDLILYVPSIIFQL